MTNKLGNVDYPTPADEKPWDVVCPHCKAPIGTICVTPKGKPYDWASHWARIKASDNAGEVQS